jgi:hypothetical protein
MREASNVVEASDGTAVGQIGTSSEKVNVVAHDVTSDSVDTDEVSHNIAHDADVYVFDDPDTGNVKAADKDGVVVFESSTGSRLLPALEAAVKRVRDTYDFGHIYVASRSNGRYYAVDDGQALTGFDWPDQLKIEFSSGVRVGLNESITNSVGPDSRSVLFDVRQAGAQTAWITFVGNGSRWECGGNVDVPFYFGDGRQMRWSGFEVDAPSVGPYRFGNEEAGTTAQFCYARDYAVYGGTATHGGTFVGVTDVYPEHARITADIGILIDGCVKAYPDDIYLSNKSTTQQDVVQVITDEAGATGWVSRCRYEGDDARSILRLDATANDITQFGGSDLWQVNGGSTDALVSLAETGSGNIGNVGPIGLKGTNVRDANSSLAAQVTDGDPYSAVFEGTFVARDQDLLNNVDRGPNNSVLIFNGYSWNANGSANNPGIDVPTGTVVENTDDGTVWLRASGDAYVQLG